MKHQIKITCKFAGLINKNKKSSEKSLLFAERGGFEPPKPFWGLLAFQAGQFNHSCIFPYCGGKDRNFCPNPQLFYICVPSISEVALPPLFQVFELG